MIQMILFLVLSFLAIIGLVNCMTHIFHWMCGSTTLQNCTLVVFVDPAEVEVEARLYGIRSLIVNDPILEPLSIVVNCESEGENHDIAQAFCDTNNLAFCEENLSINR